MTRGVSDNDNIAAPSPDAYGQAAMFLVESLLHGLVARDVLSVRDAISIVDTAAEVKADVAADLGDTADVLRTSLALLAGVSASLRHDLAE